MLLLSSVDLEDGRSNSIQMNLNEVEEMRSRLITEIETRFCAKENR